MFSVINLILLFLLFRKICSQVPNNEYVSYGRSPPSSVNSLHLRAEEQEASHEPIDLQPQDGDANVQKLVARPDKYFSNEVKAINDENNLGPDGPPQSGKKKKSQNTPVQNVNRVQEMTGQLWPMGVVPYYIDKEVYDPTTINRITKAMDAIEAVSCVIFRELEKKPKDSPDGWLHFTNPRQERECVHVFSTIGSEIELILGFDCLHPDEILHALLHALGFRDEVTHPQRDYYIRVLWNNIQPKYRALFRIRHEDASYKLVEYDPMSIMHFHDRAFTDNGEATIAAVIPGLQITSPKTLSQLDIMRLKLAFNHECNKRNIGDLLITCKKSLTPRKLKKDPGDKQSDESENAEANPNVNEEDVDHKEKEEAEPNGSVPEEAEISENVHEEADVQNVNESIEAVIDINDETEADQKVDEETKLSDNHNIIDEDGNQNSPQMVSLTERLDDGNVQLAAKDRRPEVLQLKGTENTDDDYKRIPNKFKSMNGNRG